MRAEQFAKAIEKLGPLTQERLSNLLGISPSTVKHYLKDGVTNTPTAILMTLVLQKKITVDDIRKTRQSHGPTSAAEEDDFYRRTAGGPVTIVDRRLR
jgi:predicted transcriptional regulator